MRGASIAAVTLAGLLCAAPAAAQLFSPGKLAAPHAELEGLDNCTKCHPKGGKLSEALCLDCHTELKGRVKAKRGYHGRLRAEERACETCHHDHKGRKFRMIRWNPKQFDHREAGWALAGAHARTDCETCHEPRLIQDRAITKLLRKRSKKKTFLGLGTRCVTCHFDEHRGQLSNKCERCHDEEAFSPAEGFEHAKTDFALRGAHRKVDCKGCHPSEPDTKTRPGTFPAPAAKTFARYSPIEHGMCTDCHEDPHRGRFGAQCTDCHTEQGWDRIRKANLKKRDFHEATRYPLRGRHTTVACKACHLPLGKRKQVFRGLPFDRCDACHLDAHQGQAKGDCDACHDLEGFLPPRYGDVEHAKTEYPLEGAHQAVGCARCHVLVTPRPRVPRRRARALKRRKRAPLLSDRQLNLDGRRCSECHTDVHRGQLAQRVDADGCEGCHGVGAWSEVRLDHQRETRFPLTGAHLEAACAACHASAEPGAPVAYRPLDTACAACHEDVHLGQLSVGGKTDCARCHATAAFEIRDFDHGDTRWPLDGKHADVACARCHLSVEAGAAKAVRYRPLPTDCEACHADYHSGAFDGFRPVATSSVAGAPRGGACIDCHRPEGWSPAAFDHAQVGWALTGRHAQARCSSCHGSDLSTTIPRDCATCHQDPHRGELGLRCVGCHTQSTWKSRFDADAHRGTAFPLAGAHAVIPCEECHSDTFGRGFVRAAAGCERCHADDYSNAALTSLDHVQAGFDMTCQRCHNAWSFENGRYDAHDGCFLISAGPHAGIPCAGCHDSLQGVRAAGQCDTRTARCTGCHEHRRDETDDEHTDVPGYQYEDRKCYECHRFAEL